MTDHRGEPVETIGWCDNSRVWVGVRLWNPKACPYDESGCSKHCGYYRERKPTRYVLDKLKKLRGPDGLPTCTAWKEEK